MKTHPASFLAALASGLGLAIFAGCSVLPEGGSDPMRFYVLSAPATAAVPKPDTPAVNVRPIELASYLRGRPLIVRRGANEIEFREFARWGEPLDLGIARVLREELLARGVAGTVQIPGARRESGPHDCTLTVRVLACEGGAEGEVLFRAVWELAATGAKPRPIGGGEFMAADLRWDGKSEAALAAQLSAAVGGLATEVAGALAKR